MLTIGIEPAGTTPAEFTAFVKNENTRFAKILKDRNARME